MGVEIERRFVVTGTPWDAWAPGARLVQGYVAADGANAVRVRIIGDEAWLTIKGPGGLVRAEFEYTIPLPDAEGLLALCGDRVIHKVRWRVPVGAHTWDVDRFDGLNAGLAIAEVEMATEGEAVVLPHWVGEEITADGRYSNAALSRAPFSRW